MRKAHEILYDADGIGNAIRMAQDEAYNEAIIDVSKSAKCKKVGNGGSWYDAAVDEESILKLLKK